MTPEPVETLAQWLRSLRERSGQSYRRMAHYATANLHQQVPYLRFFHADRGERLPAWSTVRVYVRVCGGDEQQAYRLWKQAASAGEHRPSRPPLKPEFIRRPLDILDAMRAMRGTRGEPGYRTLRELELLAGPGRLPRSTLGAVLGGRRMPSKELLLTFVGLTAGVAPGSHKSLLWAEAWERADLYRRGAAS
ncbi:hypothetical protein ABZ543_24795 [Streptomyces roseifaciens]